MSPAAWRTEWRPNEFLMSLFDFESVLVFVRFLAPRFRVFRGSNKSEDKRYKRLERFSFQKRSSLSGSYIDPLKI